MSTSLKPYNTLQAREQQHPDNSKVSKTPNEFLEMQNADFTLKGGKQLVFRRRGPPSSSKCTRTKKRAKGIHAARHRTISPSCCEVHVFSCPPPLLPLHGPANSKQTDKQVSKQGCTGVFVLRTRGFHSAPRHQRRLLYLPHHMCFTAPTAMHMAVPNGCRNAPAVNAFFCNNSTIVLAR